MFCRLSLRESLTIVSAWAFAGAKGDFGNFAMHELVIVASALRPAGAQPLQIR